MPVDITQLVGMTEKYAGDLAGGGAPEVWGSANVGEALQHATFNEVLIVNDEEGNILPLQVVLDPENGDLTVAVNTGEDAIDPYHKAIALSQMRSMLNDTARCEKYARAIENAVSHAISCSNSCPSDSNHEKHVRVLDIGTGTGLLAMLAAKAGATTVDACEMFPPLAYLAQEIVQQNQMEDIVHIYPFVSTIMSVEDPSERYDVIVTEIFDSGLLGEGALPVLEHAREQLMKPGAVVVPAKARILGQLVESPDLISRWHDLSPDENFPFPFWRNAAAAKCTGGSRLVPVHLDALQSKDYEFMSEPFEIFTYDFNEPNYSPENAQIKRLDVPITRSGIAHGVVVCWELDLSGDGSIIYSTALGKENWQDHWLQCCFPLPRPYDVSGLVRGRNEFTIGEVAILIAGRSQMEIWFSLDPRSRSPRLCSCGFHGLRGGPQRISMLSDSNYIGALRDNIWNCIKQVAHTRQLSGDKRAVTVLDISSESSICALLATQLKQPVNCAGLRTMSLETDAADYDMGRLLYDQIADYWQQLGKICVEQSSAPDDGGGESPLPSFRITGSLEELNDALTVSKIVSTVDILVAEPWKPGLASYPVAMSASLWLRRAASDKFLSPDLLCVPRQCSICCQLIEFEENTLSRSFQRCNDVLKLDHSLLDRLCKDHLQGGMDRISIPIYMYKHRTLSDVKVVYSYELKDVPPEERKNSGTISTVLPGRLDALAVWAEYDDRPKARTDYVEIIPMFDKSTSRQAGSEFIVECYWSSRENCGFTVRIQGADSSSSSTALRWSP